MQYGSSLSILQEDLHYPLLLLCPWLYYLVVSRDPEELINRDFVSVKKSTTNMQ
jgi:hypothetical protein